MTEATVIRRNPAWMNAWVADEMMMMNGEDGTYLSISETGGRIWELLADEKSIDQLSSELAAEYSVSKAELKPQLVDFVEQMLEEHAVEVDSNSRD